MDDSDNDEIEYGSDESVDSDMRIAALDKQQKKDENLIKDMSPQEYEEYKLLKFGQRGINNVERINKRLHEVR